MTEWEFLKSELKAGIDFIRWDNLLFMVIGLTICILVFGWWGILLYILIQHILTSGGGNWFDLNDYPQPDRRKPCSANIKDCKYCGNGYDHEFNVEYEKSLKWYEKII